MDQTLPIPSDLLLTPVEIDNIVGRLNRNMIVSTANLFLMVTSPSHEDDFVIGTSIQSNIGGRLIRNSAQHQIINSKISAAAIISPDSLSGVTRLSMLVIDKSTYYHRFTNSTNKKLVSAVIVAKVQRNQSFSDRMNISLYFTKQSEPVFDDTHAGHLACSYYDPNTLSWDESGCTLPIYDTLFSRYACSCNHLTTFALLYIIEPLPFTSTSAQQAVTSSLFRESTNMVSSHPSSTSSSTTTTNEITTCKYSAFIPIHINILEISLIEQESHILRILIT